MIGLIPAFFAAWKKLNGAEDVAVVGHGHGGHAQLLHAPDQLVDVAGAVEQGVIGMQVKVDEVRHGVFFNSMGLNCRWEALARCGNRPDCGFQRL